jgi:hypothetical protein
LFIYYYHALTEDEGGTGGLFILAGIEEGKLGFSRNTGLFGFISSDFFAKFRSFRGITLQSRQFSVIIAAEYLLYSLPL